MYYIYDSINNYDKYQYDSFYNNLSSIDKNKYNNIVKDNNKKLFLLSRILLDRLTNKYYNTNYKDMVIKYNSYGKPLYKDFYFNISHSNSYGCAVISNNKIGIDIEKIREVDLNIINYFCTDKEVKYILNSKDKYKSLFTIFCLKEAYFKMIGTGINNIKSIEFVIDDNIINCNKNNINIKLDYYIDNYVIAIIEEKD